MTTTAVRGRLRFADPRLERLFWRDSRRRPAPVSLLALFGVATMLLFAVVDVQLQARQLGAVLSWRALTILAPAVLLASSLARPRGRRVAWIAVTVAVMGIGGAGVLASVDAQHSALYQPGVLILLVLAYTGLRLPFRVATAVGLTISAAELVALGPLVQTGAEAGLTALYLVAVNGVGMLTAFGREALVRERFLTHLELSREHRELARLTQRLERLSLRDELTAVGNRRALRARLDAILAAAARGGGPATLAVLDLDRFKQVNDRLGHAAGDELLCRVARLMEQEVRRCDEVFRYGGDEFCVLMPVTRLEDGVAVIERLLARLAGATAFDTVPVGFSAGCAVSREGDDHEALLHRADAQLYAAKEAGRGRVSAEHTVPLPAPTERQRALRLVG